MGVERGGGQSSHVSLLLEEVGKGGVEGTLRGSSKRVHGDSKSAGLEGMSGIGGLCRKFVKKKERVGVRDEPGAGVRLGGEGVGGGSNHTAKKNVRGRSTVSGKHARKDGR